MPISAGLRIQLAAYAGAALLCERHYRCHPGYFFARRSATEKYPFAIRPNATARADFTRLRGNNKKALTGTAGVRGEA